MIRFSYGQLWLNTDRTLLAEVVETADEGHEGVLEITDRQDIVVERWAGNAALFQHVGAWHLAI